MPTNKVILNRKLQELELCNPDKDEEEKAFDFMCNVCSEFMVNPTTLGCGHSFCMNCTARFKDSSQGKCPFCRRFIS